METLSFAKEVFAIEAEAITALAGQLTADFEKAVQYILGAEGKVIISGMGKSGLIGKKIAATLASTGTSSFFMHPGEAYHGDLGMIAHNDVVIAISHSGETDEILKLIPFLKDNGNVLIAMTGKPASRLAKNADAHLNIAVSKEACPFDLTPTASTTACMAMGDALAITLMRKRNFQPENFARFHPGGTLGKRLLTTISEVMRSDNLPMITQDTNVKEIIHVISTQRLGLAVIVDGDQKIKGIITDGDIRRMMETREEAFFSLKASDFPSKTPKSVSANAKLAEAEKLMNQYKINSLLVAEKQQLVGVVQIYDIV